MANDVNYEFTAGKNICIAFDSNGYVTKAKGFENFICSSLEFNKDLVGKHIDEVAEILKEKALREKYYNDFEINVHIPLLKIMLEEKEKNNN